jgi:hypothetical protein
MERQQFLSAHWRISSEETERDANLWMVATKQHFLVIFSLLV